MVLKATRGSLLAVEEVGGGLTLAEHAPEIFEEVIGQELGVLSLHASFKDGGDCVVDAVIAAVDYVVAVIHDIERFLGDGSDSLIEL